MGSCVQLANAAPLSHPRREVKPFPAGKNQDGYYISYDVASLMAVLGEAGVDTSIGLALQPHETTERIREYLRSSGQATCLLGEQWGDCTHLSSPP